MDQRSFGNLNKSDGPTLRSRPQKRSSPDIRPVKRLFTPAIKRHLKSWLVRRRENPYPNREEKIQLATQTGLTYIQICNWFANWRRKLKNAGKNVDEHTWSTLIKSYNDQALGNVEHLSISSDDSIWEEGDIRRNGFKPVYPVDHCYSSSSIRDTSSKSFTEVRGGLQSRLAEEQSPQSDSFPQCFQISSTTDFVTESPSKSCHVKNNRKSSFPSETSCSSASEKRYRKRDGVKKTFRDKNWNYRKTTGGKGVGDGHGGGCSGNAESFQMNFVLSKWNRSSAFFRPRAKTHSDSALRKKMKKFKRNCEKFHGREELDAAEALTFLARASTNK